jgi:hypothetical protein
MDDGRGGGMECQVWYVLRGMRKLGARVLLLLVADLQVTQAVIGARKHSERQEAVHRWISTITYVLGVYLVSTMTCYMTFLIWSCLRIINNECFDVLFDLTKLLAE